MNALTLATQLLLVVTVIVVGGMGLWGWLKERHWAKYRLSEQRIPILWAQGTLRRKER